MNHRLGLHNVHLYGFGEFVHIEVVGHIAHLHIAIHAQNGINLVYTLYFTELALGIVTVRLKCGVALVTRST